MEGILKLISSIVFKELGAEKRTGVSSEVLVCSVEANVEEAAIRKASFF